MNDQRIAEWLDVDAPFGAACDDDERALPTFACEPFEEAAPATARPATLRSWRRLPAALGLERQEARILELVIVLARRMRRRPLAAVGDWRWRPASWSAERCRFGPVASCWARGPATSRASF